MKTIQRNLTYGHIEVISFDTFEQASIYLHEQLAAIDDPDLLHAYQYVFNRLWHTMSTSDNPVCVVEREAFLTTCERDGIDRERSELSWRAFCRPLTA